MESYKNTSQIVDMELLRDIILIKYNKLIDVESVYDIEITRVQDLMKSGDIVGFYISFNATLLTSKLSISRKTYEDIVIDLDEYKSLLRQKKLKEIGV